MPRPKGCIISPEHRQKLRESRLGKKASKETRLKLSLSHKGQRPWAKGKHWKIKDTSKMHHPSWMKGKTHSIETKRKISESLKGHIMPEHQKELSRIRFTGKNNPRWKGGITPEIRKIRNSLEMKLWRKAVFERDNYTCIWCGVKFIKGITGHIELHADHIKSFKDFPELRFAIDNGRTLCKPCHLTTENYGVR